MNRKLLDDINRKLILLLEEDPEMTDADLARRLNLAQSTIAARIDKLRDARIVVPIVDLNISELGFQTGIVEITTTRPDLILNWANKCPLFVNAFKTVAGNRLSMVFVAEDPQSFHEVVDEHLLKIEGLIGFSFSNILEWTKGLWAPLDLTISAREEPPCGVKPFCSKCPANPNYSGNIWGRSRSTKGDRGSADKKAGRTNISQSEFVSRDGQS